MKISYAVRMAFARSILLMVAGYLMSYIKVYHYSTIFVTFSAIGAVALITGSTEIITLERILFVGAGVILALLINKFILPYKLKDANSDLKAMYDDTIHEMLLEISNQIKGTGNSHAMKNLILFTNMIEDRLKLNNQGSGDEKGTSWLQSQRRVAATIYELDLWIHKHSIQESNISTIASRLNLLLNLSLTNETLHNSVIDLKEEIQFMHRIEDRIVLSMILEITEAITLSKTII